MSGHPTGEQPDPGPGPGAGQPDKSGPGTQGEAAAEAGLVAEAEAAAQARQVSEGSAPAQGAARAGERQAAESPEEQEARAEQEAGAEQEGEAGRAGPRVHQLEPDEHSPLAALSNAISANFRRAFVVSVLALAGLGLTYVSGGVLSNGNNAHLAFFTRHEGLGQIAAVVGAVVFLVFGVVAVRMATNEILKTVPPSLGDNRRNGLRWVSLLVGYVVVIFGTLGALNVPVERLLVGGAVTGVILGIAAQQSLGNLFAGLMLLLTRPFAIGDEVSLRSGPLGGVLTGLIADMNLTYVKLVTDNGTILLPNSTLLTAAIGPPGAFDVHP